LEGSGYARFWNRLGLAADARLSEEAVQDPKYEFLSMKSWNISQIDINLV
jgi:hypothetical protein